MRETRRFIDVRLLIQFFIGRQFDARLTSLNIGLTKIGISLSRQGAGLVTSFRNAHAPQVMIHGSKPISATVGNYNAVYRVLKGTPHEWMLERHLEPKSSR